MKSRTTAKTIRIPNDTYADIKREAGKKELLSLEKRMSV